MVLVVLVEELQVLQDLEVVVVMVKEVIKQIQVLLVLMDQTQPPQVQHLQEELLMFLQDQMEATLQETNHIFLVVVAVEVGEVVAVAAMLILFIMVQAAVGLDTVIQHL